MQQGAASAERTFASTDVFADRKVALRGGARPLDRLACASATAATSRTVTPTTPASTDGRHVDRTTRASAAHRFRRNETRVSFEEHAFNEPWSDGEHRLTLFSAGHVLGSSQLLIEGERGRVRLYRRLQARALVHVRAARSEALRRAADGVHVRPAAVRLSAARRDRGRIVGFAARALADGCAPVFFAYSLGKAQEAIAILAGANVPVTVHGAVARDGARVRSRRASRCRRTKRYEQDVRRHARRRLAAVGPAAPGSARTNARCARRCYRLGARSGRRAPLPRAKPVPALRPRRFPVAAALHRAWRNREKVWLNHGWPDFDAAPAPPRHRRRIPRSNPQLALF